MVSDWSVATSDDSYEELMCTYCETRCGGEEKRRNKKRTTTSSCFEFHVGVNPCLAQWCSPIVQELCESRGGCPELSVLTSLLVSVDVKLY